MNIRGHTQAFRRDPIMLPTSTSISAYVASIIVLHTRYCMPRMLCCIPTSIHTHLVHCSMYDVCAADGHSPASTPSQQERREDTAVTRVRKLEGHKPEWGVHFGAVWNFHGCCSWPNLVSDPTALPFPGELASGKTWSTAKELLTGGKLLETIGSRLAWARKRRRALGESWLGSQSATYGLPSA